MSKLMDIKKSFESKTFALRSVVIHDISEQFNLNPPTRRNWWTHTVTMLVYPRRGMYKLSELTSFSSDIASRTALYLSVPYSIENDTATFAMLSCDEPIGKYVEADPPFLRIDDPDMTLPDAFTDGVRYVNHGKTPSSSTLLRRIVLRIYPDKVYAQRALQGIDVTTTTRVNGKTNAFLRPVRS